MVVIFHSFKNFKHGIFTLCLLINLIAWIGLFLFRIFSTFLLERAAVPLISFTNITNIIIKHPFVATGLVIEFIVFLLLPSLALKCCLQRVLIGILFFKSH